MSIFNEAAKCFKVIAHPQRLKIIYLLREYSLLSVGEIAEMTGLKPHVSSEHLKLLAYCGLVSGKREGRSVRYEVIEPHLFELLSCIERKFAVKKSKVKR